MNTIQLLDDVKQFCIFIVNTIEKFRMIIPKTYLIFGCELLYQKYSILFLPFIIEINLTVLHDRFVYYPVSEDKLTPDSESLKGFI